MKKETFIVSDNLIDVVFVKPEEAEKLFNRPIKPFKSPTPISPEQQLLSVKDSFGIKVQSVALPKEHQLFSIKSEVEVLNWLQNKIKSVHTANYILRLKYEEGHIIKLKYADSISR